MFCREYAAQLRDEFGRNRQLTVAVVTMGGPSSAGEFCRRQRLPFVCLSDPRQEAYRAYGLKRGNLVEVVGPAAAVAGFRAMTKGHRQGRSVGDTMQLGGAFLIDTQGVLRYVHYPAHSGDHPAPGTLTQARGSLSH
ncbi:MAG: AhpC/TSA family protein [Dehalococcoidia bacterium]